MQNEKRVAIVTGSNKGIGFEIVKGLCQKFDGIVYLTARNIENGQKAIIELKNLGFTNVKFHQCDIENVESLTHFASYLIKTYGGIDVLVNNAAIHIRKEDDVPIHEEAVETLKINFFGTLSACDILFPLLRPNARCVNVTSRMGFLERIKSEKLVEQLSVNNLSREELILMVNDYIRACENGSYISLGYPMDSSAYCMSKIFVNALTEIQQRQFDLDSRKGIIVSSVTPGWCKTDLTRGQGIYTAEEGAQTPIFLCLLPDGFDGPKGAFWAENKTEDWKKEKYKP